MNHVKRMQVVGSSQHLVEKSLYVLGSKVLGRHDELVKISIDILKIIRIGME